MTTHGPDPNRWRPGDPDLAAEEEAEGGGLGSPASTRLHLSSWAIVALVLVVTAVLLALML